MLIAVVLSSVCTCVPQGPRAIDAAQSAPPSPRERVLRTIPLRDVITVGKSPRLPRLGNFLPTGEGMDPFGLKLPDKVEGPDLDQIIALARDELGEAADEDGFGMYETGTDLVVAGAPETVERASALAAYLAAALTQPIEVTVSLYRAEEGADVPTVIRAGLVGDVTGSLEKLWEARALTKSGLAVGLGRESYTPFVADFDVEVAQRATIGDPQVRLMFEGIRVVVEPHALSGSRDIVAFAQLAIGERRGVIGTRSTGNDQFATIDVPVVENNGALISGRIGSGGALVYAADGASGGGGRIVVVIRCARAGRAPAAVGSTRIYPATGLTASSLRRWIGPGQSLGEESSAVLPLIASESPRTAMDPDYLIDLAREALGEMADEEGVAVDWVGGCIAVRGGESVQRIVFDLVQRFEERWLRTARVVSETRLLDEAGRADGQPPLHRISLPALIGRPHFVMRGIESTSVRDFDVEIAERAAISNPVVESTFGGVLCAIEPYATQDGLGARIRVDVCTVDPAVRRPKPSESGTDLYVVRTRRSEFAHRGPIESGQELRLGEGPIYEDPYGVAWRTEQTVRVDAR